jgi:uncharacterized protein YbjT (DUF2867 family)
LVRLAIEEEEVKETVFVTGGTGYIGRPFIEAMLEKGYIVYALARPGSVGRLPRGTTPVIGDATDSSTFDFAIPHQVTLVHLVGTPHPNPAKASEFRSVDLASIQAATMAAQHADVKHLVYVSVAHPAPIMQAFIAARREGEIVVETSGIPATIVRPWYVLGPGHRWPHLLVPLYAVLRQIPATRSTALRLGLVTRREMIAALLRAVDDPPVKGVRFMDVPEIRWAAA